MSAKRVQQGAICLASLAALATHCHAAGNFTNSTSSQCRQTSVLILGAGTAGITAAQALSNQSVTDFVIVEYQPNIGGRMFNQPFGRQPNSSQPFLVEYGANWVQGIGAPNGPQNPIWTLAQKYQLINTLSDYDSIVTYDHNGLNNYSDLLDAYSEPYSGFEADAGYILTQNLLDNNVKTGLALNGWFPGVDMIKQAVDWWSWDFESAYSPEKSSQLGGVAGYNVTRYYYSEQDQFVHDPRGFNAFLKGEASAFLQPNDTRLLLNTIITNVSYSDNDVTIQTQDGQCVQAPYAICTFSAGVLQNSLAGIAPVSFDPPLPRWKQTAIQAWNMGIYTKIFYQFPPEQQFWDTDTQFFLYADNTTRGYYPIWQSLSLPGFLPGSGIIFVTVTDDQARRVEAQDDSITRDEGLEVLRRMFPNVTVPEPIAFAHPRWGSVPWAYGSYSNWPTGVTLRQHQNLRASVNGRLFFAGEHTSAEFFGFLQGAWFEGQDAGLTVAKCVQQGGCVGEVSYNNLMGTTPASEYSDANGWAFNTFATYGLDAMGANNASGPDAVVKRSMGTRARKARKGGRR